MIALSPARQLYMLALSLFCGFAAGAVYDVFGVISLLLGAYAVPARMYPRYQKPLPLVKKPVPLRRRRLGRVWRGVVVGALDCLFVLSLGVATVVILFVANDGQFRAAVPILLLAGFFAWRLSVGRLFDAGAPLAAFLLSAAWVYLIALLLLPPRLARRGVLLLAGPLGRLYRRAATHIAQKKSRALCRRHVALAACGFETEKEVKHRHETTGRQKQNEQADLGHPRHHHRHFLRVGGHRSRQTGRGAPKETA